ncbi:MAG: glycerol-3-phosphate 1-O-acyltransferase [bacterium]|nr:glycerol-3-phosphate 1-O-acyltransferase [bacterium]
MTDRDSVSTQERFGDWPVGPGREVVFLLDAASALEERILHEWIDAHRPEGTPFAESDVVAIASTRRPERNRDSSGLDPILATRDDAYLAPLRVLWLPKVDPTEHEASLWDLLRLGDDRDPGRLRERFIRRFRPERCQVVAAEPATVAALRERWRAAAGTDLGETVGLSRFVSRQAALALDRAERRSRDARYKVARFLHEQILATPAFQGGLEKLARETGQSSASVRRAAQRYLKEIAAKHSPRMIDVFAGLSRSMATRGYDAVRYDRGRLAEIRALAQQHPVVFLPTHKSNVDHMVVFHLLHEDGLPPPHTAGGINMNFFPLGPLARRAGIFFIRRTFADNPVYKFVLRAYIDFLVEKRFPLEWYIEGGRSRSGKLLPPRYGMLSYVVDSFWRGKSDDVILLPISIAYDQISEVTDYSYEDRGGTKQAENAVWFAKYLARLGGEYGSIEISFGDPLSLREALGAPQGDALPLDDLAVPKLAFEVCARMNRVTPITPIALGMLALLGRGDRAMSVSEILFALRNLASFVSRRGLPTTAKLDFETEEDVQTTLDPLVRTGVLQRFDEGPELLYSIKDGQHLAAAYYRNTLIHFLLNGAIVEVALVSASEQDDGRRLEAFWEEAMRLRDLLKFEFFFSDKEVFAQEIESEIGFTSPAWKEEIIRPGGARDLLERIRPYHAHRTLRAFVDAYQIVADRLYMSGGEAVEDRADLLSDCLSWGKQYTLQRRIRSPESVSKVLLDNGIKLAENRGLMAGEGTAVEADRALFVEEVRDTIRRIRVVNALAQQRMAGALD